MVAAVTITRFVAPAEYGLVALAMLCCRFPNYLSQLGISRAVVQKPNLTIGNVRAAFTMSMGLGLAGCAVVAAISPLLAAFFHEPRLMRVLIVLSLNFIFQGAILVSGGLLRRALKMRELAIADTLSYLVSTFAIGLPIAIKGYGVWAIVTSTVTQTMITALLYFVWSPHSLLPTFDRENYEHIVSFGSKATGSSIIEGLGGSVDTFLLGRFSSASYVGLYNRSGLLIQLPTLNISNGLTRVLFTRLSRAAGREPADALKLFVRSQRMFLAIIFPLCAGAAAAASCIVLTLYGSKWSAAIPVFAILCAATAADSTHHLPGIQMEALGRFRHKVIVQVLYMVCIAVGILLSIPRGLVMVGVTLTGLQSIRSVGLHYYTARYLNGSFREIIASWIPGLIAAVPVGASISFLVGILNMHPWIGIPVQLIVCILTGFVVSAIVYAALYRKSIFNPLMALVGLAKLEHSIQVTNTV
jgi:O-antigen/teichoic acid export membrane protein